MRMIRIAQANAGPQTDPGPGGIPSWSDLSRMPRAELEALAAEAEVPVPGEASRAAIASALNQARKDREGAADG